jgi:hypothetical protein
MDGFVVARVVYSAAGLGQNLPHGTLLCFIIFLFLFLFIIFITIAISRFDSDAISFLYTPWLITFYQIMHIAVCKPRFRRRHDGRYDGVFLHLCLDDSIHLCICHFVDFASFVSQIAFVACGCWLLSQRQLCCWCRRCCFRCCSCSTV